MLDVAVNNTEILEITCKLNELLKNCCKVLHIDKYMSQPDKSNPNNLQECFGIYLRSDTGGLLCKVLVREYQIAVIEGSIYVDDIERINDALAEIKEMRAAA